MAPQRAIRILHLFPSFAIGGQQRRLATLSREMGEAFSHRVISLDGETGAAALFETLSQVDILALKKSGGISPSNIVRLTRAIANAEADLLCTYNFGSIEAVIANRLGPRLPHVHHEDGFGAEEAASGQKLRRVLARRFLLSRARVVVPSKTLEAIAVEEWKLPRENLARIDVGIDLEEFRAAGARRREDRASRPVTVGAIGALRAEKNFARLIRAFTIASEGSDARLVIIGDGPERARLETLAAQSAAASRISLPGATTAAARSIATFDIFALSSDTEQMPTSLIEAMASGLPFVATDVGDVRDMAGDGTHDFIVSRDDEDGFAARLRQLIADARLREEQGRAGVDAAARFDKNAMVAAFAALYGETARGAA